MKILIITAANGLLYCYKADTEEQKDKAIYNYIKDNCSYTYLEDKLQEAYNNGPTGLYRAFTNSYIDSLCQRYDIETIIEIWLLWK